MKQAHAEHTQVVAFAIDGTWTLNPKAWRAVFEFLQRQGFCCIIVTGAQQPQDKLHRLEIPRGAPLIVSGGLLKEEAARRAGYRVAVWIDDMPGTIQACKVLGDEAEERQL